MMILNLENRLSAFGEGAQKVGATDCDTALFGLVQCLSVESWGTRGRCAFPEDPPMAQVLGKVPNLTTPEERRCSPRGWCICRTEAGQ